VQPYAMQVVGDIVTTSPKLALGILTASLAPKKMAAIIDEGGGYTSRDGVGGAGVLAAAVFAMGDAKRREHDPKVAAVLSAASAEAAGAVVCAGAAAGNADRAAAVVALMDLPANSRALAAAAAADGGKSRPLVSLVLAAMPVEPAARLVSRATYADAAVILATYPPDVAVAIISTGAVDADAAVAAVGALEPAAAAAILDALQQKALFSLADKVGIPLQMVTRVVHESDRGFGYKAVSAAKEEAESQAAMQIAVVGLYTLHVEYS
jgi:hypothetical protein